MQGYGLSNISLTHQMTNPIENHSGVLTRLVKWGLLLLLALIGVGSMVGFYLKVKNQHELAAWKSSALVRLATLTATNEPVKSELEFLQRIGSDPNERWFEDNV